MQTERDVTRIVRSWLRTDEHESADRVLDTVLDLLDATPQRRPWWPARRIAEMHSFAKLAMVAAAVVVVAIIGITLMRPGAGVGDNPAVPPSSSPTPGPSTDQSPAAAAFPQAGALAIGRHSVTRGDVTFTFELTTPGWTSNGTFSLDKDNSTGPNAASFVFWTDAPDGVYADPCARVKGPPIGPSAAELADAVSTIPGIQLVEGPSDVTVGGRPAKHVVIDVPADAPCGAGPGGFHLWYEDGAGGRWAPALESTISVWIIDVDGTLIWIDGEAYRDSSRNARIEVDQIVDSIVFE